MRLSSSSPRMQRVSTESSANGDGDGAPPPCRRLAAPAWPAARDEDGEADGWGGTPACEPTVGYTVSVEGVPESAQHRFHANQCTWARAGRVTAKLGEGMEARAAGLLGHRCLCPYTNMATNMQTQAHASCAKVDADTAADD
eukprot:357386-Chlamydomonas_euryale.AAC.1